MSIKKLKLIYVLAASHSGSTLTSMLLGAHKDIITAGELKATSLGNPEKYRCSCKKKINDCEFWNKVSKEMDINGFAYSVTNAETDLYTISTPYIRTLLRPLVRGWFFEKVRDLLLGLSPKWKVTYSKFLKRNFALIASIANVSKRSIIVDSSKIGIRLKYLLQIKGIDVFVVRVVRDGRAVALTYMDPARFADASDPKLRGGGGGLSRDSEMLSMKDAANEWLRSNEEGENLLGLLNHNQFIQIKYEELCNNPKDVLSKIFSNLELDYEDWEENFKDVDHHVVGNGMRLDDSNEIVLDERWKKNLSEKDLKEFDCIAGELNAKYGYQ